jgi:translation initiation factor IF-2
LTQSILLTTQQKKGNKKGFMSERIIRINKVLRELNISLERAVDYLKDKGIAIEANPNTKISDDVYNVLCGQFAGDRGKKEAQKK